MYLFHNVNDADCGLFKLDDPPQVTIVRVPFNLYERVPIPESDFGYGNTPTRNAAKIAHWLIHNLEDGDVWEDTGKFYFTNNDVAQKFKLFLMTLSNDIEQYVNIFPTLDEMYKLLKKERSLPLAGIVICELYGNGVHMTPEVWEIWSWIQDNLEGRYWRDGNHCFYFEKEKDAVMFKMRWFDNKK